MDCKKICGKVESDLVRRGNCEGIYFQHLHYLVELDVSNFFIPNMISKLFKKSITCIP